MTKMHGSLKYLLSTLRIVHSTKNLFKIIHLPLGLLKSLWGSVTPGGKYTDGVPDLKIGAMAPVHTQIIIESNRDSENT